MKNKYRELFEDVKLSESAIKNVTEKAEELQNEKCKRVNMYGGRRFLKAAALLGVVLTLGVTVSYAAVHFTKRDNSVKMSKEIQDKRADIKLGKDKANDKQEVDKKKDSALYDVKLSYIPKGYKQDKTDSYLYRDKKGDGYFSVILYHLQTEYRTARSADKVKELETELGKGYYGGRGHGQYTLLVMKGTDYMVYIDGSNMPQKEVKKIAQGASLTEVKTKKDIQASYIEYTKEKRAEADKFIKEAAERAGKK